MCALGACNMGFRNCDGNAANGCEIDAFNDSNNCGGCGSSCAQIQHATASCKAGACVVSACAPDWGNCDKVDANGCETDVTASPAHCGGCGKACPAPPNVAVSCSGGNCMMGGCLPGY